MKIHFKYNGETRLEAVENVVHRNDKIEFSTCDGQRWTLLYYNVDKATQAYYCLCKTHYLNAVRADIDVMNHELDMQH